MIAMQARNPDLLIIGFGLKGLSVVGMALHAVQLEYEKYVASGNDPFDGVVGLEPFEMKDALDQIAAGRGRLVRFKYHAR